MSHSLTELSDRLALILKESEDISEVEDLLQNEEAQEVAPMGALVAGYFKMAHLPDFPLHVPRPAAKQPGFRGKPVNIRVAGNMGRVGVDPDGGVWQILPGRRPSNIVEPWEQGKKGHLSSTDAVHDLAVSLRHLKSFSTWHAIDQKKRLENVAKMRGQKL